MKHRLQISGKSQAPSALAAIAGFSATSENLKKGLPFFTSEPKVSTLQSPQL